MTRPLGLALALLCAASVLRADAAGLAEAPLDPTLRANWSQSGFQVGVGLSSLSVFNAAPLAYDPLDLGWRFENGLRVRVGLLLFYYEGQDDDKQQPLLGTEVYSYEMTDLRSSLEYVVPLPFWIRPVTGLSVDLVSGTRHRADRSLTSHPSISAWSVLAPGALLGLELRGGPHWAIDLLARYANGFSETGSFVSTDLNWNYLF